MEVHFEFYAWSSTASITTTLDNTEKHKIERKNYVHTISQI